MKAYLMIKRLRAQHVNTMTSWNVVGAPAITAHAGFAGAIAHRYGLKSSSVMVLHHGLDHEGTYVYGRLYPNRVRGVPLQPHASIPKKMDLSDQPFAVAHYEASLVVELEGDEEQFVELANAIHEKHLEDWLYAQARFAGGVIRRVANMQLLQSLSAALDHLPKSGHVVLDRRDLIEGRSASEDQLDAAIQHLYPLPEEGGRRPKGPWLAMSLVGFVRLTEPKPTLGARKSLPHAYVEPLLGLVEYRPYRQIKDLLSERAFWSYTCPAEGAYAVQGHDFHAVSSY